MGQEKSRLVEAEDNWISKARAERVACEICGATIPYSDREVYYSTKMCSSCEHNSNTDE